MLRAALALLTAATVWAGRLDVTQPAPEIERFPTVPVTASIGGALGAGLVAAAALVFYRRRNTAKRGVTMTEVGDWDARTVPNAISVFIDSCDGSEDANMELLRGASPAMTVVSGETWKMPTATMFN